VKIELMWRVLMKKKNELEWDRREKREERGVE